LRDDAARPLGSQSPQCCYDERVERLERDRVRAAGADGRHPRRQPLVAVEPALHLHDEGHAARNAIQERG
jgi:ribosomal protein L15E